MPPYEIIVDEARHAVRAKLVGFWDIATTQAYIAAFTDAARRVARDGARSWWLIDLSDATVQSREVAELMGGRLPRIIPKGATMAIVQRGSLNALQAKRVVADDTHIYFPTAAAAEEWLTAQGRPE